MEKKAGTMFIVDLILPSIRLHNIDKDVEWDIYCCSYCENTCCWQQCADVYGEFALNEFSDWYRWTKENK